MLSYVKGNIFESPAHVLVNTVNIVGVMGKGIAKTYKEIYPDMFKRYQQLCEQKKIDIGKLWLFKTPNKWILNFPTKKHWRSPSKLEYIEAGLKAFTDNYADLGITNIAFPPLGCGNGELNWEKQVQPLMEKYLGKLPIDIFIYLYDSNTEKPEHKNIKEIKKWLRSEPSSLGFSEVWDDLKNIIKQNPVLSTRIKKNNYKYDLNENIDNSDNEAILIKSEADDKTIVTIGYDEWINIWSIIRNYGFITEKIMPFDYNEYYDAIISLLLELSYCEEVVINKKYSALNKGSIGVQLSEADVPESKSSQLELQF